jgi:cell division protein FtsQ
VADDLRGVSDRLARLAEGDPAPRPRQVPAAAPAGAAALRAQPQPQPRARPAEPAFFAPEAPPPREAPLLREAPPPREALPTDAAVPSSAGLRSEPALRRPEASLGRAPLVAEPRPAQLARSIFRAPAPRLLALTSAGSSAAGGGPDPVRPRRPVLPAGAGRRGAASRGAAAARVPRDPAPSRLSYRMHRLWLTPLFRAFLQVGVPGFAAALAVGLWLSDEDRRAALAGKGAELVRQVQERPEFMVNLMAVEGASPEVDAAVRTALPVHFPVSSFDLDLEAMRAALAEIDAVASADLRIRPGGILEVKVVERVPAVLWRGPNGLFLLDAEGHRVAAVDSRLDRPDLPLLAGEGAERAVPEALRLIEAAAPVAARLRGLVRMGERRWDVVLDRGQRILLPAEGAVEALERVMALAEAEAMLERDVTVIDMRFGQRPTLRLSPAALETFRGRTIEAGATNG